MQRLALFVALVAAGGCGDAVDDRPATFPYVQAAILEPTCAKAQCHSSFKQEVGDDFGSIDESRVSLLQNGLVIPDLNASDPQSSFLVQTLTVGVPSILDPGTFVRMPYDEPMPAADIKLIEKWIGSTNALGLGAPGAQCEPNSDGVGCFNGNPVPCDVDGNVTSLTPTTTCSNNQTCDVRSGTCVAIN
jgi:hypothetical protein|nr:hypothetical protein [Kofleriaceae bacterium]